MVLPEPVGPVTSIIPLGEVKESEKLVKVTSSIPKSFMFNLISDLSRSRKTILSPKFEGRVDTLISIHFSPNLRDILPS